jgi:hypothetical protein
MPYGFGTIHVKRERGALVVQGDGKTPRGGSYIRATKVLKASQMGSKTFKGDMAIAVDEMLAQTVLDI